MRICDTPPARSLSQNRRKAPLSACPSRKTDARRRALRRSILSAAAAALALHSACAHAATPDSWIAGSGTWTTQSDWSLNAVPNSTAYDAIIAVPATVTLSTSITVDSVTLNNANSQLNQTGGTLSAGTFSVEAGTYSFSGGILSITSGTLTNSGTITESGTAVFTLGSANTSSGTLNNQAGAVYNLQGNVGIQNIYSSTCGIINNAGLFDKTAGTGTSTISVTFNNTGTVEVDSGTLSLQGGGTMTNSNIVFTNGGDLQTLGVVFAGTQTLSGNGTLELPTGYSLSTTGNATISASNGAVILVDGGAFNANGTLTTLSSSDTLNCTAGGIAVGGGATLSNAGTIAISGGNLSVPNGVLTNSGKITESGTAAFILGSSNTSSGTLNNQAGAVYNLQGNVGIQNIYSSTCGIINNAGLFDKTAGTGTSTISVTLNNTGTLEVDSGTLSLQGPITGTGTLTADNGGVLLLGDGATAQTANALTGTIMLSAGRLAVTDFNGSFSQNTGTYATGNTPGIGTMTGNYSLGGGSLEVKLAGATLGSYDQLNVGGNVTLHGGGLALIAENGFSAAAGNVFQIVNVGGAESGTFTGLAEGSQVGTWGQTLYITYKGGVNDDDIELYAIPSGGSVPVASAGPSSSAYLLRDDDPTDGGTVTPPPTTYTYGSLDLLSGSSYTLAPNATLDLTNGPLYISPDAIFTGDGTISGNVINAGLVRIPIVAINQITTNTGVVYVSGGTNSTAVTFSGGGAGGGGGGGLWDFTGSAPSITAPNVTNESTLDFVARLSIQGSYQQLSTGSLRLFIGGNQQGVTYSFLNVTQTVNLSGQLEIVLQPDLLGFVPTLGEKFDLITATGGITLNPNLQLIDLVTVAGDSYVSQLPVSVFNSGITNDPDDLFQINQTVFDVALVDNNTTLEATVVEQLATPTPEPTTFGGLLVIGSAAMMRRRRRSA